MAKSIFRPLDRSLHGSPYACAEQKDGSETNPSQLELGDNLMITKNIVTKL